MGRHVLSAVVWAGLLVACEIGTTIDGRDAGSVDSGALDSGALDAGTFDAGGRFDGGSPADAGCGQGLLGLNDVSFLYPLPASPDAGGLLTAESVGPRGRLLPMGVRSGLPVLETSRDLKAADVVIVGARVDHCFRLGNGPCRPQLRLIGQPLIEFGTVDATLHLFYDLTANELTQLVTQLRALKALAGDATRCVPLSVHPVMAKEGLHGPYATALNTMILNFAGAQNLSRIAVMTLFFGVPGWGFSAFDVNNQTLTRASIARAPNATEQSFLLKSPGESFGFLTPTPVGSLVPSILSSEWLADAGQPVLSQGVAELWRIDDPTQENPGTVDCVSCHVAERARETVSTMRGASSAAGVGYQNPRHPLTFKHDGFSLRSQRIFGYLREIPSLSVRVVNESAEVADALNAMP